jgi:hypothetical protein
MLPKIISTAMSVLIILGAGDSAMAAERYRAELSALNADKIGTSPAGLATFEVKGGNLEVHIKMTGVPAGIEHWEHFHGFPTGKKASCVTPDLDRNKDGYLDLGETEPVSGTTMVPFNDKPEEMNIPTHTYPHADASGSYEYTKVVPLKVLEAQFGKAYGGKSIDLDKRVIYVHGVPEGHALPTSVGSLGPIPSHVTLPIACGKIVRIK